MIVVLGGPLPEVGGSRGGVATAQSKKGGEDGGKSDESSRRTQIDKKPHAVTLSSPFPFRQSQSASFLPLRGPFLAVGPLAR